MKSSHTLYRILTVFGCAMAAGAVARWFPGAWNVIHLKELLLFGIGYTCRSLLELVPPPFAGQRRPRV